jgi:plastocyanin
MNLRFVQAKRVICVVLLSIMVLAVHGVLATTHVVQFGGSLGFVYSPSSFNATVGDTVKWEGDFSMHPLSSTSVPSGAQTWHMGSGSTFSYSIAVAGSYHYQCDVHASIGMIGSFTATGSAVKDNSPPQHSIIFGDIQIAVNQVSRQPFVTLTVPKSGHVAVEVFDLSGRQQAAIMNRTVQAGTYSLPLGSQDLPGGFYFVKVSGLGVQRVMSFFMAH